MIVYNPTRLLKRIAPEKKLKKLVKGNLTLNRAVLSMFDDVDFVSKKSLTRLALKTIRQYKKRYKENLEDGSSKKAAKSDAVNDAKLLIHRVQSSLVHEVAQEIKEEYSGEFYRWLPSDADEPDPLHQLKYGKIFQIGDGEMPGDRFGCRCAAEILVKDTKLAL